MQTFDAIFSAVLLNKLAGSRVVERIDRQVRSLHQRPNGSLAQLLRHRIQLDIDSTEQAVAKHVNLPGSDIRGAVQLRADVVFLDPISVDDAQLRDTLSREVIGKVRAERTARRRW